MFLSVPHPIVARFRTELRFLPELIPVHYLKPGEESGDLMQLNKTSFKKMVTNFQLG